MKKILVMSDTYGNLSILKKVLSQEKDYNIIFHLGDNYEDLMKVRDFWSGKTIYRVPGIFHPGYLDGSLEHSQLVEIEHIRFLLIHNFAEIDSEKRNIDVFLFGHSHHLAFQEMKSKIFLNPGHLKAEIDRGDPASYLVMEIIDQRMTIRFKNLDNQVIFEKDIRLKKNKS